MLAEVTGFHIRFSKREYYSEHWHWIGHSILQNLTDIFFCFCLYAGSALRNDASSFYNPLSSLVFYGRLALDRRLLIRYRQ